MNLNVKRSFEYLKQFNNKNWEENGYEFLKKVFGETSLFNVENNSIIFINLKNSIEKITVTEDTITHFFDSNTEFGGFKILYKNCLPLTEEELENLKNQDNFLYINITNIIHGDLIIESNLDQEIKYEDIEKISNNYTKFIIKEIDEYSNA